MLDHRLQILLDDSRYEKVRREAERRGVSIGAIIRDAIDRFGDDRGGRREALDAILAAAPMEVPEDPRQLRRELDRARDLPHT